METVKEQMEQETEVNEVEEHPYTGLTDDGGWESCHPSPCIPATDYPALLELHRLLGD